MLCQLKIIRVENKILVAGAILQLIDGPTSQFFRKALKVDPQKFICIQLYDWSI